MKSHDTLPECPAGRPLLVSHFLAVNLSTTLTFIGVGQFCGVIGTISLAFYWFSVDFITYWSEQEGFYAFMTF